MLTLTGSSHSLPIYAYELKYVIMLSSVHQDIGNCSSGAFWGSVSSLKGHSGVNLIHGLRQWFPTWGLGPPIGGHQRSQGVCTTVCTEVVMLKLLLCNPLSSIVAPACQNLVTNLR